MSKNINIFINRYSCKEQPCIFYVCYINLEHLDIISKETKQN